MFVATFLSLVGVVSLFYPDKPSSPKAYEDGLEKELGGPNALPVSDVPLPSLQSPMWRICVTIGIDLLTLNFSQARKAGEDKW